MVDRRCKNLYC